MKYVYIVAHQLLGTSKPKNSADVSLETFSEFGGHAFITYDLDDHLFEIDRGDAFSFSLLKSFVGQGDEGSPQERIARELDKIRAQRSNDSSAYLIYRAEGEMEDWNPQHIDKLDEFNKVLGDFNFVFDGANISQIKELHKAPLSGLISTFALASEHICGTKKIAEGNYFLDETGKTTYSISFNDRSKMSVIGPLTAKNIEYVNKYARLFATHDELVNSSRLLTKSLDEGSDKLLSFISIWSALEIFVNKVFKYYEAEVFDKLKLQDVSAPVIDRIRDVMSDKYRITDKFSLVSDSLTIRGA
jgi:hypothetical protein